MKMKPLELKNKKTFNQLIFSEIINSKVSVGFFQKDFSFVILWLTVLYKVSVGENVRGLFALALSLYLF
jgi:hypothetical protein